MRARFSLLLLTAGVLALTSSPALAHHSFAAEFDAGKPIHLQGTVTKMEWVNPHTWLTIDVKKPDGTSETWEIEGGAPNSMFRRGFNKDSLPVGTVVVVDGYRAKNGSMRANGRDLTFADGKKMFMGSSGTGSPVDGKDPSEGTPKP